MLKISRFIALALLVVALSLMTVGCGGQKQESPSGEGGTPQVAGGETQAPEEHTSGTGTEIGQIPPSFTLSDLDGNEVTLSDFAGKVVILDLWATWCPPCRQEIPFLVSLYEEYKDQGLAVVGVGLDRGGADVLSSFVDANSVTYTILVGNEAVSRDYRVSSIPTTFMIGRDGRVASREVGFAPSMQDQMRARVTELLSQQVPGA
jgi:thiol-disulfide isomerase/thioredoxin